MHPLVLFYRYFQVFDRTRSYVCLVHIKGGLKRPSGIFLDQEEDALYVLNLRANNMVKYIMKKWKLFWCKKNTLIYFGVGFNKN